MPLPNTKLVSITVPERLSMRVFGHMLGWKGSGKNFLTGG